MALETQQNHYQVLGVERTADERAIKKAYFALVRKFPPDTHPEDFKKIRAAYEVLSDPLARKRFDAADPDYAEYGESVGASLRAAAQAARSGNEDQAQQYLRVLLTNQPDLHVAREMLGQSYMRSGNLEGALAQFEALVAARPEEAKHHLHRGYALRAQDKDPAAEAAFKKARDLRPDDVEIRMALADSLADAKRYDEALAEIQAALSRVPDEPGPRLHIELRRLDIVFLKKGGAPALRELDTFVGRVRKDPDKEFWKYASSQLAALAARLFARQSFDDANAILERCSRLNPGSLVEHPYPHQASLDLATLPERSRKWLASLEGGGRSPTLLRAVWGGSLWALIGAAALVVLTVYTFFNAPWAWGPAGYLFAALFIVGTCVAVAASLRAVHGAATSEVRPLLTIHPLYLLQTTSRRLKVWPLVNLLSVNLTRHSTNGVYTYTQVAVKFGRTTFTTPIRNEAYAKNWADYILETRRRLLDLLHHGYLEAEPNVDLLPPKLLRTPSGRRWRWLRPDRWLLAGAGVGLLLYLAAIPWNFRLVDEAAFAAAARAGTAKAYNAYLKAYRAGRFAPAAREEIRRRFKEARASLELASGSGAPGLRALRNGLAALAVSGQTGLPLVVTWEVGEDVAAAAAGDAALKEAMGDTAAQAQRDGQLVAQLQRAFRGAGLTDLAQLERKAAVPPDAALALTIRARYGLDGTALEGGGVRVSGLRVAWEAAFLWGPKATAPGFKWETTTSPPDTVDLAETAGVGRTHAYMAELDAACADFAAQLGNALGLGSPAGPPAATRTAGASSPYKR